jgi:hypothetical protein
MISDLISKKVKGGIRSTTARNIKNCLSAILRHAVNPDGFISVNPARDVPIPKPEDEQQAKEQNPFTWDERALIEKIFKKDFQSITLSLYADSVQVLELVRSSVCNGMI